MSKQPRRLENSVSRSRPLNIFYQEGEKPADVFQQYSKMDQTKKQMLFEHLVHPTSIVYSGFLDNLDKNRVPIPIAEKKRVKPIPLKEGDTKYVPAVYANLERDEYVIWQAPTKDNYLSFWRSVWQDQTTLIFSLSDSFSETDPDKCFPYWPMKENSTMKLQDGRCVISFVKKNDHNGFWSYELEVACTDEPEAAMPKRNDASEESAETVDTKVRQVTLFHFDSWQENTWPNVETFATCIQMMARKEIQTMRKSVDQYMPPVIIQSYAGIGRAAVAWVAMILMKDVEKKDCFDIPDLIRKFIRLRPGSFNSKLYYCAVFAIGFRCAGLTGWLTKEEVKKYIKDIETAFKDSK